jgi:putative transposase
VPRAGGVARAGLYAFKDRSPSAHQVADQVLTARIRAIHSRRRGTYGAPRVHAELRLNHGVQAGRKRVAPPMRAAGLVGCHRRRRRGLTRRDPQVAPAPDLVNRDFTAQRPDQVRTAAITYIPTWSDWLYLAIVLDVWSRRVVGWAMAEHLRTELVVDALDMAIWRRRPAAGLVYHSDQGCQCTSLAFGRRLREAGLVASIGSVADCFDNAVTGSFFATLECELLDRTRFATRAQARTAVSDYLEGFSNPHRRHSTWATSALPTSRGGTPTATLPPDLPAPKCPPNRGNSKLRTDPSSRIRCSPALSPPTEPRQLQRLCQVGARGSGRLQVGQRLRAPEQNLQLVKQLPQGRARP